MITIDEAAKKWSCSKNTVLSYVYKRYITGMCVDGETLLLPDIENLIFRANVSTAACIITEHSCEQFRENGLLMSIY
mgnify:CR=1 FL=1